MNSMKACVITSLSRFFAVASVRDTGGLSEPKHEISITMSAGDQRSCTDGGMESCSDFAINPYSDIGDYWQSERPLESANGSFDCGHWTRPHSRSALSVLTEASGTHCLGDDSQAAGYDEGDIDAICDFHLTSKTTLGLSAETVEVVFVPMKEDVLSTAENWNIYNKVETHLSSDSVV